MSSGISVERSRSSKGSSSTKQTFNADVRQKITHGATYDIYGNVNPKSGSVTATGGTIYNKKSRSNYVNSSNASSSYEKHFYSGTGSSLTHHRIIRNNDGTVIHDEAPSPMLVNTDNQGSQNQGQKEPVNHSYIPLSIDISSASLNQGGNAQGAHRSILELVQAAERGEELSDFERQQIAISILLNSQEVRDYNDSLNGLQLDLYTRAGIAGALPKPKGGGDNSPTDWAAIARAAAEAGSVLPGIGLPADLALLGDAFVNGDNLDVGLAVFGFLPFGDLAKPFKGRLKLLFKGADPDAVNVSKLDDYYGVEKGWADGATPNSKYTQVHPENNKAIQSTIYDENGKAIGHVDWKEQHGIGSGHGHEFEIPGDFSSGHQGKGKLHLPEALPEGWVDLPPGIDPIQPIK